MPDMLRTNTGIHIRTQIRVTARRLCLAYVAKLGIVPYRLLSHDRARVLSLCISDIKDMKLIKSLAHKRGYRFRIVAS